MGDTTRKEVVRCPGQAQPGADLKLAELGEPNAQKAGDVNCGSEACECIEAKRVDGLCGEGREDDVS